MRSTGSLGDNIVLASTDFDPNQAEALVVQTASANQVTVTTALKYTHWGVMQTLGGAALDERARSRAALAQHHDSRRR